MNQSGRLGGSLGCPSRITSRPILQLSLADWSQAESLRPGASPGCLRPLQVKARPYRFSRCLSDSCMSWQVLALARQQNKKVKVVGGGHSPSDIACTDGFMIHMGKMNRVLQVREPWAPPLLAPSLTASTFTPDPRAHAPQPFPSVFNILLPPSLQSNTLIPGLSSPHLNPPWI